MRNILLSIILTIATGLSALGGDLVLTIIIRDLRNDKGNIVLELRDGENNFIKGVTGQIRNNECTITIRGLEAGTYSFKYFHDENRNNKMDTYWIGVPKEGYGFSNNASGTFGPPAFEKTIFAVTKNTTVSGTPLYIEF